MYYVVSHAFAWRCPIRIPATASWQCQPTASQNMNQIAKVANSYMRPIEGPITITITEACGKLLRHDQGMQNPVPN